MSLLVVKPSACLPDVALLDATLGVAQLAELPSANEDSGLEHNNAPEVLLLTAAAAQHAGLHTASSAAPSTNLLLHFEGTICDIKSSAIIACID